MIYLLHIFLCLIFIQFVISENLPPECPKIISRTQWGARVPDEIAYSLIPVEYVIIHHTVTPECNTDEACSEAVSNMQTFHMDSMNFHDIGYNFVIGGDGSIYEGVGWHKIGAHTKGYNSKSIGIALIGMFTAKLPNQKQLDTTKALLSCGVALGELDKRYKLLGALQLSPTRSPGLKLYREIQTWPNFVKNPPKTT